MPVVVVLSTFPSAATAAKVARILVHHKLAACVNLVPNVRSIYAWRGKISDDREVIALIKTTTRSFAALKRRLVELHPYEVPEVIALPVKGGHAAYLDWVAASTNT